jgi:hypothetical protein
VHPNAPIVGVAAAPDGGGYWLVASDGVFAYSDAGFYGSASFLHLNDDRRAGRRGQRRGYWQVASDGGIFNFGDSSFYDRRRHVQRPNCEHERLVALRALRFAA